VQQVIIKEKGTRRWRRKQEIGRACQQVCVVQCTYHENRLIE
jgi:hypothetical protein